MDVDSIIAEVFPENTQEQEVTTQEEAQVAETEVNEPAEAQPEEAVNKAEEFRNKPDSELTPEQLEKRERNRYTHERSKLARQLREKEAEIERLKNVANPAPVSNEPNIDDFETYSDYTKAMVKHELAQEKKEQVQQPVVQQNSNIDPKIDQFDTKAEELARLIPDFKSVYEEYVPMVGELPPTHLQLFLDADNGALALYNLAQEGRLGDIGDMTLSQAALAIAKAEVRNVPQRKTITNAPAPINTSKGSGVSSTPLASLSFEQLKKEFGLK